MRQQPLIPETKTMPDETPKTAATRTENDALLERLQGGLEPKTLGIPDTRVGTPAPAILIPQGMKVYDPKELMDRWLPRPVRRSGKVVAHDLESFVALVKRYQGPDTVVYVDARTLSVVAVLDDHEAGAEGAAAWREHRVVWSPSLSPEWKAWMAVAGQSMSQVDFAEFIEAHALDLLDPSRLGADHPLVQLATATGTPPSTPPEVVQASRGLKLRAEIAISDTTTLASGETELAFVETHKGQDGTPLRVPTAFLIALPVFERGVRDPMLARLRYRRVPNQARVQWTVVLQAPEAVHAQAVTDAVEAIRGGCSVPVVYGTP